MEPIAGLLCVAFVLFVPLWTLVRFSSQGQQVRLLRAESDDLRLALQQTERALLVRIEALEAAGGAAVMRREVPAAVEVVGDGA